MYISQGLTNILTHSRMDIYLRNANLIEGTNIFARNFPWYGKDYDLAVQTIA